MSQIKYRKTQLRSKYQDPTKPRKKLGKTKLVVNRQPIDLRKAAARRRYSMDGYYYDDGGMSHRRGRAPNGRYISRDGSEMARRLREMIAEAPDDNMRQEIQRLADKMENM